MSQHSQVPPSYESASAASLAGEDDAPAEDAPANIVGAGLLLRVLPRGDDHGASVVEYAILVTLIAAVVIFAVGVFGGEVAGTLQDAVREMNQIP